VVGGGAGAAPDCVEVRFFHEDVDSRRGCPRAAGAPSFVASPAALSMLSERSACNTGGMACTHVASQRRAGSTTAASLLHSVRSPTACDTSLLVKPE